MCGIFGFFGHETQRVPDPRALDSSARSLSHRGPDHHEIFRAPGIGLVHTRLSLVDLDPRSNQPFWDENRRHALVYNGEIYNYPELRTELERVGRRFRTEGDTEVLLQALLEWGAERTLPLLEGMFAFALYDAEKRELLLARDRIGMKPLYLYEDENRFVFSSEIRAMKPWIPWRANRSALAAYLKGLHWVPEGHTLYEGVRSVVPGSYLRVRPRARSETRRFHSLSDFWDESERERLAALTPTQVVDEVEEKLRRSVEIQLRADAPLGAFCSGGVDSSLIAAIAVTIRKDLTIFHSNIIGRCSEYDAAKALADHLKTRFVVRDVTDRDFLDRIPDTMQHAEFPYRHLPTSTPFLLLSETARSNGVKGLLTGEASDEAFLGYPHYAPNLFKIIPQLPARALKSMKCLLKGSGFHPEAPIDFLEEFHRHFEIGIEKDEMRLEISRKAKRSIAAEELLGLYDFSDNIRALTHRNDAMGMAAGIETRFPFLDSSVIRAGINLPSHFKLRPSATTFDPAHPFIRDKWVVRKVADRYLPRALSRRVKTPWPTTFLDRLEIAPAFFKGGSIQEWLGWSDRAVDYLCMHAPKALQTTMMYLEVWAHVCFYGKPKTGMKERMARLIGIRPEPRVETKIIRTASSLNSGTLKPLSLA